MKTPGQVSAKINKQVLNGIKSAIPLVDTGAAFKQATRETANKQGSLI